MGVNRLSRGTLAASAVGALMLAIGSPAAGQAASSIFTDGSGTGVFTTVVGAAGSAGVRSITAIVTSDEGATSSLSAPVRVSTSSR